MPVLLDSHVLHWWSAEPNRLSRKATAAISNADELAVAAITWFELAWLASHDRIAVNVPGRTWLEELSADVRTIGITPAIADLAATLPASFPGDPADRLIFATSIDRGWPLVTNDRRLRDHPYPRKLTVW